MALFASHVLHYIHSVVLRCDADADAATACHSITDEIMEFNETINYKVPYRAPNSIIEI